VFLEILYKPLGFMLRSKLIKDKDDRFSQALEVLDILPETVIGVLLCAEYKQD
jgi:hypothetical protein